MTVLRVVQFDERGTRGPLAAQGEKQHQTNTTEKIYDLQSVFTLYNPFPSRGDCVNF